jgi:hypothetical protein
MPRLQMDVRKYGKLFFKSALLSSAVLVVVLPFSPWGSRTGILSPIGKAEAVTLVTPSPSVTVLTKTATVNAGAIQAGDFSTTIEFTVAANVSKITMFLEASDLYRGGDPTDPRKIGPIALNTSRPAEIIVPTGTRIAGPPNNVSWLGVGNAIANFPGKKTETVTYEFTAKGDTPQNVSCKIWYSQGNVLKTSGQYSGQVRLNASVAP